LRQVRDTVQQVLGEARDKRGPDVPNASVVATDVDVGNI
jgi:hypothetical protein